MALLSFRTPLVIQTENSNAIMGGYDYLADKKMFVIEYSIIDQKNSILKKTESTLLFIKQENDFWIIGNLTDDCIVEVDNKTAAAVKNHIISQHFFHNEIMPNRKSVFHVSMKNMKEIAA